MAKERKYLDEFEMSLLEKYGIKILKKKYDVLDLLEMLPKRWKEYDNWATINFWWDDGMREWHCTTPYWFFEGACVRATWNDVRGDTLLTCLLNAVLTLAKRDRGFLSKTYVVEDWKYKPENWIDIKDELPQPFKTVYIKKGSNIVKAYRAFDEKTLSDAWYDDDGNMYDWSYNLWSYSYN